MPTGGEKRSAICTLVAAAGLSSPPFDLRANGWSDSLLDKITVQRSSSSSSSSSVCRERLPSQAVTLDFISAAWSDPVAAAESRAFERHMELHRAFRTFFRIQKEELEKGRQLKLLPEELDAQMSSVPQDHTRPLTLGRAVELIEERLTALEPIVKYVSAAARGELWMSVAQKTTFMDFFAMSQILFAHSMWTIVKMFHLKAAQLFALGGSNSSSNSSSGSRTQHWPFDYAPRLLREIRELATIKKTQATAPRETSTTTTTTTTTTFTTTAPAASKRTRRRRLP